MKKVYVFLLLILATGTAIVIMAVKPHQYGDYTLEEKARIYQDSANYFQNLDTLSLNKCMAMLAGQVECTREQYQATHLNWLFYDQEYRRYFDSSFACGLKSINKAMGRR